MRELQRLLQDRAVLAGDIDGTYGPELRTAIEAYEKAEGLPRTGLATQALLQAAGGGVAMRGNPGAPSPKPATRELCAD